MRVKLTYNLVVETVETTRDLTNKEIAALSSGKLSVYDLDCIDWETLDRIDSDLSETEVEDE